MRRVSLRTCIACTLLVLSLFVSIAATHVGSAHAASVKTSAAPPWSFSVSHVDPNATLSQVNITFSTHDDNKDFDTSIAFLLQERINAFFVQDLARGSNLANGTEFVDRSLHTLSIPVVAANVKLSDLVNAPTYRITITPVGHDTWIFDSTLTLVFSDGSQFSTVLVNQNLNQNNRTLTATFM